MKYSETLEFLFSRLPIYQRIGPAAYKNDLYNIIWLDNYYGNPHNRFKTIHVAGTNGKGSVSHMLASVLQSAGYKTGLYTSPHLKDFRERIRIDGRKIGYQEVSNWVEKLLSEKILDKIHPSFFELTVAMAFDYFAKKRVDVAVIEVGLGGRLDSTNIITPEITIITNIGMDHTSLLGDSLEKIAYEKAGVIKPGIPVVVGTYQPETAKVFERSCSYNKAPLFFANREYNIKFGHTDRFGKQVVSVKDLQEMISSTIKLDLQGIYQLKNLPAVLKAISILQKKGWGIIGKNVLDGLSHVTINTGLQGRWQVLRKDPLVICDSAHNVDGFSEVVKQISKTPFRNLYIIFGMVNDKDPSEILKILPKSAKYYFTRADIPRAMDENELCRSAAVFGLSGQTCSSVAAAYRSALENAEMSDLIFVGGSTFVVAEVL